jgi:allophanate hydrolase subunit 2
MLFYKISWKLFIYQRSTTKPIYCVKLLRLDWSKSSKLANLKERAYKIEKQSDRYGAPVLIADLCVGD